MKEGLRKVSFADGKAREEGGWWRRAATHIKFKEMHCLHEIFNSSLAICALRVKI